MLTEHVGLGPALFRYGSGAYQKAGDALVVSNGVGNWFPPAHQRARGDRAPHAAAGMTDKRSIAGARGHAFGSSAHAFRFYRHAINLRRHGYRIGPHPIR
jgi:hypothetical protein